MQELPGRRGHELRGPLHPVVPRHGGREHAQSDHTARKRHVRLRQIQRPLQYPYHWQFFIGEYGMGVGGNASDVSTPGAILSQFYFFSRRSSKISG